MTRLIPKHYLDSVKRVAHKMRTKWTQFSYDYFESKGIQAFVALVAIASVVCVIMQYDEQYSCEYKRHEVKLTQTYYTLFALDILLSLLTLFDYSLALTFFPSKFGYLYSWRGVCDSLSALPILKLVAAYYPQSQNMGLFEFVLSLLVFFRLSKLCRIGLFYKQLKLPIGTYYIIVMVDVIVIFLLFVSAVLLGVDHYIDEAFTQPLCIWTTSLYFTVTVISTVGFGDISANHDSSRILLSLVILVAVAMIPFLMATVMQLLSADSNTYSLSLYALPYDRWICICGISPSPQLIRDMLNELSSTPEERAFMIIILAPELPGIELSSLLNDIAYSHRIKYYLGSAKDPADLARIRAEWANAIYIIGDVRFEASLRNQEDSNYLTCIAVNKYLNKEYAERQPDFNGSRPRSKKRLDPALARLSSLSAYGGARPVVVARLPYTAKNKQLLLNKGFVHVAVSQQELKYALLSYGAIFPGFLSLFTQLCIQPEDSSGITGTNGGTASSRVRANMADEGDGACRILEIPLIQPEAVDASQSLFPLPRLSPQFLALTFEQAVCYLYTASGGRVVPIGVLQIAHGATSSTMRPNGMGKIFLNPSSDRGSREFNSELSEFQAIFVISSLHRWDVLRDYCVNFDAETAYSMISNFGSTGTSVSSRVRRSSINQGQGVADIDVENAANVKLRSSSITGIKEMIAVEMETRRKKTDNKSDRGVPAPVKQQEEEEVTQVDSHVDFGDLVRSVYTPLRPTSERVDNVPGINAPVVVALKAKVVVDELVDSGLFEGVPESPATGMPSLLRRMSSAPAAQYGGSQTNINATEGGSDPNEIHLELDLGKVTPQEAVHLTSPKAVGCVEKPGPAQGALAIPRFIGHIVLIIAASNAVSVTARAYLIPIIAIVRSLRREVTQHVVILSEKIPELENHLSEIETAQPGLLRNVLFVEGTNRHLDHLQSCNLEYASVVMIVNPLVKAPRRDVLTGGASNHTVGKDVDIISKQALVEEDRAAVIATLNVLHALELVETDRREHLSADWKPPFVVASIAHHSNSLFLPAIPVHPMDINTGDSVAAVVAGPVPVATTDNYDESTTLQTQSDYISTGSVLLHGSIEMLACIQSVLNPNIVPLWEALLGVGMEQASQVSNAVLYRKIQQSSPTGGDQSCESDEEDLSARIRSRARHKTSAESFADDDEEMEALNRAADAASAMAAKLEKEGPQDPLLSASFSALDKICIPPGFAGTKFGALFAVLYSECGVIAVAVCRYMVEDHSSVAGQARDCDKKKSADPSYNHVLLPQVLLPTADLELQENDELFIVLSALLN